MSEKKANAQYAILGQEEGPLLAKKYVSIKEATLLYSMGRDNVRQIALDAGALYQVKGKLLLINTEIFERYLEGFKLFRER